MDKQQAVLDILQRCNFGVRQGAQNINTLSTLAPYTPLHKNDYDDHPSMGIKVH